MAWTLRTKSFVFSELEGKSEGALDFWSVILGSNALGRHIYYALCILYALVSMVALRNNRYLLIGCAAVFWVQLVRIQLRVPDYGWTTQKVFHLMNFVVNGSRAVLFGLYKSVFAIKPKALEQVLMDIPGLLFFSTYTLLVLFWAEIYYQARNAPANKLRPAYYMINGVIYFIQISIWVFFGISQIRLGIEVAKLFLAVASFCAALGFVIYGGRLFVMLRRFPIESSGRQKKLYEVGSVTTICCTCFFVRCIMLAVSALERDMALDVFGHPIINLVYYLLVEIIPSALVLFILRKLPPRRASDNYHPIK